MRTFFILSCLKTYYYAGITLSWSQYMKVIIPVIIAAFIIALPIKYASCTQELNIECGAAVVIDGSSKRILYQKNANSRVAIASTTKIMTAIVALENSNQNETITVSKKADGVGGSTMKLSANEKLSMESALYGLMLRSGNDAAIAIAEHVGGCVPNFAKMMNDKASRLGLYNTRFVSPHGLDVAGHYSTAYELALMARHGLSNPIFARIVATPNITIGNRTMRNTNDLLNTYPGANGVKTGFTGNAGRCLVASATRNDFNLISVILNCPTKAKRTANMKKMLDYVFEKYKPYVLLKKEQFIKSIEVKKGIRSNVIIRASKNVKIPLATSEFEKVRVEVTLPEILIAPVKQGVVVGDIKCRIGNELLAEVQLKTEQSIAKKHIIDYMYAMLAILANF